MATDGAQTGSPGKREPIAVRSARINHLVLGRYTAIQESTPKNLFNRDSLLDALFVLYEELNNDSMRKDKNVQQFLEKYRQPITDLRSLRVSISDFEVKKVIGRGHFGEVKVVQEKTTGEVFAMKTLQKSKTLSQQNVAFYEEERDIMAQAQDTKWITQLHYAYQDTDNLYLVMEFLPGGDLLSLLDRNDNILSEEHARFYLAELVQAINTLHTMGYVHRDIKPDNILIDRSGHLKLADFGSAARLSSKKDVTSKMPVGTPDYIAPEVLQAMNERGSSGQTTYGTCCDWWSLGIVAYEMLYGQTPFSDERVMKTYVNIINFKKTLVFPAEFVVSPEAISLITALLEQADKRLDYKKLLEHKFFEGTFWTNIRQLVPPFVPQLTGLDDTSNFDDFEDVSRASSRGYLRSLQKKEFETSNLPFVGFTHTLQAAQHSMTASVDNAANNIGTLRKVDDSRRKELQEKVALLQASENQLKDSNEALKTRLKESEVRTSKFRDELSSLECTIISKESELKKLEEKYQHECALRKRSEQKAVDIVKGYQRQNKRSDELIKWSLTAPDSPLSDKNQSRLFDLPQQILDQQKIIEDLTKELQKTRTIARDYKEKFHGIVADSQKCVERLEEIQNGNLVFVEGLKRDLSEAVNSKRVVENNLTNARQLCEEYVSKLKELQESNRELKIKVKSLEAHVKNLEEEIERSQGGPSDLGAECSELRLKLQRAQETNSRLEVQVVELAAQVSQLERENIDSNGNSDPCEQCESLEKQMAALRDQIADLQRVPDASDVQDGKRVRFSDIDSYTVDLGSEVDDNRNTVAVLTDDEKKQRLSLNTNASFHTAASCLCNCAEENELLRKDLDKAREEQEQHKKRWLDTSVDLRKRNEQIKELQLDLRIANREIKNMKTTDESTERVRCQLQENEQKLTEKANEIEDLKNQLADLTDEVQMVRDNCQRIEMAAETEKSKLEERLRMLQDTTSTQSELQNLLAKYSDEVKELKLKCQMLEKETEMANKRKTDATKKFEEIQKLLKNERSQLKETKENYESLVELVKELNSEAELNKSEIITLRDETIELRREKLSIEKKVVALEEMKNILALRESTIMDLKDELRHISENLAQAEDQKGELEQQLSVSQAKIRADMRVIEGLNDEMLSLKREASKHISAINTLNRNMVQLNQQLEEVNIKAEEDEEENRCLQAKLEQLESEQQLTALRTRGQMLQYAKVVELLQSQVNKSSHKKGLFAFVGKGTSSEKERLNTKEHKIRKLQQDLESARQEVMNVRSKLTEFEKYDHRRDFKGDKKSNTSGSLNYHDSASSSLSDSSHQESSVAFSNAVNLSSPHQLKAAEELTKSPTSNQALTQHAGQYQGLINRISHNIPHKFSTSLALSNKKCVLCSLSILIGKKVASCQECYDSFHVACSQKAPATCGLPKKFLEEYEIMTSVKFAKDTKDVSFNSDRPEGLVKVPKNGNPKFGWEKAYLVLEDGVLYVFDKTFMPRENSAVPGDRAVDRYNLVGDGNTHMYIDRDVLKSELREGVNTDYVLKLVVHNNEQDKRPLYMMFSSVCEKRLWHNSLQRTIEKFSKGSKSITRKIADIRDTPMYCICEFNDELLLAGGADGLHVVDVVQKKLRRRISGVPAVFQIQFVEVFNKAIMISDSRKHELAWCRMSELRDYMYCDEDVDLPPVNLLPVGLPNMASHRAENCSMFRVSKDGQLLVVSNTEALIVLRYRAETTLYEVERRFETEALTSSIQLTPSSIIFSSDKVYKIDLIRYELREFLDASDESLGLFPTAFKGPYYILEVEPSSEYLIACSAVGVFVNAEGKRTRVGDINLGGSILNLEMCQRSLFVCDDDHIQVCMVMPSGHHNDLRLVETIHARGIRYLGRARGSDAIFVAWTWKGVQCISKIFAFPVDSLSDLSTAAGNEFSFTSSIEENLERYGDTSSVSE